jgi:hypothetical protein
MKLSHSKMAVRGALLLVGACVQWGALGAEGNGAWRCGNTYTDQPCTGGKALDVDDARNSEQKRAADESTRHAQTAAERMKSDRLRLETKHAQQRPILIVDESKELQKRPARPDKDVAKKPKSGKKDPVYASWQGAEAPPKKKSKKAGSKKSGE